MFTQAVEQARPDAPPMRPSCVLWEHHIMRSIYINFPFVGELYAELGGVTRARDGRLFDAAKSPGCVELWAGSLHLTLDGPRRRPSLTFLIAAVGLALLIDAQPVPATEQIHKDVVEGLEFSYPTPQ